MTQVCLREAQFGDVEWVTAACQDREIQRWTLVPRPYTRDHAIEFVSGPSGEFARWVVESTDDRQPVGVISIHGIEDFIASIGYWTRPQLRHRGFTTAAIGLVCEEIERLERSAGIEVRVVGAVIARDNIASRRAIERARFELVNEQFGPAVEDLIEVPTCVYERRL